jgi:hypothetical protein
MRPKRTPSKQKRRPPTLDEMEALETADWVGDIKRREYKKSDKYLQGKELAERYADPRKRK